MVETARDTESTAGVAPLPPSRSYAWYALGILFLVYVLNFIDRQIITILAPDLKRDLGLDDADIGFLYGTAFAVFYALFGIPLGRLADAWHRVRLLTAGLAIWSAMTAVSGLAANKFQLAGARMGVTAVLRIPESLFRKVGPAPRPGNLGGTGSPQTFQVRKLAMSLRPVAWLFSGWNWVPTMLSRPTIAVMSPP